MTDHQRNRHEMHLAVLGTLDTHADAWASVPVMQTYRDSLDAYVSIAREAAKVQARGTEGATATKGELRDQVRVGARRLGQALVAYGRTSGLPDLAAAAYKSSREFQALTDVDLANYSEDVVALAREHLPAEGEDPATKLGRHGVTAAFVDGLDALDDAFAEDLASPREARITLKSAGRTLATAIRKAQKLLKDEVDPTVDFLAPDQPAFAQAYRDARIIVDRGRGRGADSPEPDA